MRCGSSAMQRGRLFDLSVADHFKQNTSRAIASHRSLSSADGKSTSVEFAATYALTYAPFSSLRRFLVRIARHPTLARSSLLQDFLESTQWVRRRGQAA